MHQLSRMSLLVPVFTALQNGVPRLIFEAEGRAAAGPIGENVGNQVGGLVIIDAPMYRVISARLDSQGDH